MRSLLLWTLLIVALPAGAFAQQYAPSGGLDINTCAPGLQDWQVTSKVVMCVQSTIIMAVTAFITLLTIQLRLPVSVLFVLAVVFFGAKILLGERELPKLTFGFFIRFALVVTYSFNMATVAVIPFAIEESLLSIVTGGWSPWMQMDIALGKLLGFGPGVALFQGMLGLLGAALFSSGMGAFLFLFGIMVITSLLGLVFRAIYTYLCSMVLIGFVMVISPLIIPLAILGHTERYFRKWLDLLMASMLQPMMLFAFLWVFLGVVDTCVASIFGLLGGNDFMAFWRTNSPFFSMAMVTDPTLFQKFENGGADQAPPLVKGLINPLLGRSMDLSAMTHASVSFGANNLAIMQQLIMGFISLGIVCYLLRIMLDAIPQLSDDIAGMRTGLGFERIQALDNLHKAISQASQASGKPG